MRAAILVSLLIFSKAAYAGPSPSFTVLAEPVPSVTFTENPISVSFDVSPLTPEAVTLGHSVTVLWAPTFSGEFLQPFVSETVDSTLQVEISSFGKFGVTEAISAFSMSGANDIWSSPIPSVRFSPWREVLVPLSSGEGLIMTSYNCGFGAGLNHIDRPPPPEEFDFTFSIGPLTVSEPAGLPLLLAGMAALRWFAAPFRRGPSRL